MSAERTQSLSRRVQRRLRMQYLRTTKDPFAASGRAPLLVHCGHHKAGTVWFREVLLEVARAYGLRFRAGTRSPVPRDADVAYFENAEVFRPRLGDGPCRPRIARHP